jgi:transposase
MPGVSDQVARTLIAEVGVDITVFPTAAHLVSWAGLCPELRESAGKRKSTRVRKGAPWLKPVLVQVAWPAARKKGSYLKAQFLRLRARRGPKKAAVAVAASMLTLPITCSATAPSTRISAHTTSTPPTRPALPSRSCDVSRG